MFVAATSDGRVLVADMDNHRIQLFGSSYPAAWRGEYHDNRYLVKPPVLAREEAVVDFYWGDGSPDGTLPTDGFSARWRRTVYLSAGTYRFLLAVDDGARLWVDGRRIIDVWRDQEMAEHTASVTLSEGYHHLLLEYYENTGGAAVQLGWAATATRTPPPTSEVGHVYLSLLMKPAPTPTPTPEPACREPANNFAAGACGPLVAGVVYRDYIASEEDSGDWVYFDLAQSQRIEIWLRELCNTCDFDLYLFRDPPDAAHQIGYSGVVGRGAEEHIIAAGPGGGRYYIWVRRVEGWSTTQPYALQIALSAGSAALADSHDAHPASVPIQFVGQPEAVVRAEAEIPVPPTSTGRFNGLRFLVSTSGSNDTCSATVLRMSE